MSEQRQWGRTLGNEVEPWRGDYNTLLAIARSGSIEEFRRLEPGFNRAFRAVRGHVYQNKQGKPGLFQPISRDRELMSAVWDLWQAVEDNPIFGEPAAARVRGKLADLHQLSSNYHYKPMAGREVYISGNQVSVGTGERPGRS